MEDFHFKIPRPKRADRARNEEDVIKKSRPPDRAPGQMRVHMPEQELWIVEAADHVANLYDLVAPDGYRRMQRVETISIRVGKIPVGATVKVRYRGVNKNIPYIKWVGASHTEVVPSIVPPEFPPDLSVGLWVQHGGWWWNPNHARQSVERMKIEGNASEAITGASLVLVDLFPVFGFDGWELHFPEEVDFGLPGKVFQDGIELFSWPPNAAGYDFAGSNERPDLGIPVNHSKISKLGEPAPTSSTFTANYTRKPDSVDTFYTFPESADALSNALSIGGINLIPASGGSEQVVAMLTGNYQAVGDILQVNTTTDTIHFTSDEPDPPDYQPADQQTFQTEFTPLAVPTLEYDDSEIDVPTELQGNVLQVAEISPLVYALPLKPLYTNTLYFLRKRNYEQNRYFYIESDGSTSYTLDDGFGPIEYDLPDGTHLTHEKFLIESLIEVRVDGELQVGTVSFDGGTVIFDDPPSTGSAIEITVDLHELEYWNQGFGTGVATTFTITDAEDGVYEAVYADINGSNFLEYVRLSGNSYTYYYVFRDADLIKVTYQYHENIGSRYNCIGVRVHEKNAQTNVVTILDATFDPVDANPVNPETGQRTRGMGTLRGGQLFYDPASNGYTIGTPAGLMWRSRVPLNLPASRPPTPAVHFTLTDWPDDGYSADSRPVSEVFNFPGGATYSRRYCPYDCLSAVGPYALQGSWNRVGDVGDTDFFIRLWKRDKTTYIWENHVSISVKLLAQNPSPEQTLRILGAGRTGPYTTTGGYNITWFVGASLTRNYEAWIVPASWVVHYPTDVTIPSGVKGYLDAGLTINAIKAHTGELLAQFTIKPDPELILPGYVDHAAGRNQSKQDNWDYVDQVIDKYVNDNPDYWPPNSGTDPAPPWAGGIIWAANNSFHAVPINGSAYFVFPRMNIFQGEQALEIRYPGIPCLCDKNSKTLHWNGDYASYLEHTTLEIPLDEDNNMFFSVTVPTWKRQLDSIYGSAFKQETVYSALNSLPGEYTSSINDTWEWITDPTGAICFAGNVLSLLINGTPDPSLQYWSSLSGVAELLKRVVGHRPYEYQGLDEDGHPIYFRPAVVFQTVWTHPVPDPEYNAFYSATYTPARPLEYFTFEGFQNSPMPYVGIKLASWDPKWQKELTVVDRHLLYKMQYVVANDSGSFVEKWKKDITQNIAVGTAALGAYYPMSDVNMAAQPLFTRQAGRFIFVVRDFWRENPTVYGDPVTFSCIEVYLNQDTEPDVLQRVEIPKSRRTLLTDAQGSCQHLLLDVDGEGREHLTLWHSGHEDGSAVVNNYVSTFHFKTNQADPPEISTVKYVEGVNDFPYPYTDSALYAREDALGYWRSSNQVKLKA